MKRCFAILMLLPSAVIAAGTNALPMLVPAYGEIPPTFWELHGTVILVASLCLVVLGAIVLWLKLQPKLNVVLPPATQAREALAKLRGQLEDGPVLSRISQILRRYLCSALQLPSDEPTTADISIALASSKIVGEELAQKISGFLRECDAQKFSTTPAAVPLGGVHRALLLIELTEQRRVLANQTPATR